MLHSGEVKDKFCSAGIAPELKARPQWVCWRRTGNRKAPLNARTGRSADYTKPKVWSTFDEACQAYTEGRGRPDGIGFVFSADDPFCGIDLDDCIDSDRNLAQWASEIVERFKATYIEVSPSGHGLKVFLIGRKICSDCKRVLPHGQIECYDRKRYFTLTGDRWLESAPNVSNCQEALEWLCREYLNGATTPPPPTTLTSNTSNNSKLYDISQLSNRSMLPDEVVEATQPNKTGNRNDCVFSLARGLKFEAGMGKSSPGELRPHVRAWHQRALPIIGTKPFDETWSDFLRGFDYAKVPLTADLPAIAVGRALMMPAPEVEMYESKPVRLLVSLCRELAFLANPDGRFFLSSYRAASAIGVKQPTAFDYLRMLEADGIIQVIEKGTPGPHGKATRYCWLGTRRKEVSQ